MNEARSPDEIERDITDLRTRISETLDAVQDKLSPGQLLDQVLSYTKEEGGAMVEGCARAVRHNPVPAALVGVGLAWLLYANNRPAEPAPARVALVDDVGERAREQARAGLDWSRGQAERACAAGIDYVKRKPLNAVAIALGVGAVIGGVLLPGGRTGQRR